MFINHEYIEGLLEDAKNVSKEDVQRRMFKGY